MPIHLLSDVDLEAISIVGKGANRKQFFLRKEAADEALIDLPGPERLVKAADWSAVYCVVAEPGWHEEPGVGADQSIEDRWASEDEIRKAAHRFMKNGALINRMHETLEPFGELVESTVALADFDVDGTEIKKGSWYIAIEPTDEGREAIEKGDFTGVSIQGKAIRTLVDKSRAESSRDDRSLGTVEKGFIRKLAERAGISKEDLDAIEAEELAKAQRTFAARMAGRDLDEELPQAMDVLRDVVWSAFYPYNEDDDSDPKALISQSLDEFKAWALELIDRVPGSDIAKSIEALGESTENLPTVDPMSETDLQSRLEAVEKRLDEIPTADAIAEAITKKQEEADKVPTAEELGEAVEKLTGAVEKVAADVKKLGEGESTQTDDDPKPGSVEKSAEQSYAEGLLG